MNIRNILILITLSLVVVANSVSNDIGSFGDQIQILKHGTNSLCSHIQQITLVNAKKFQDLLYKTHNYCCPNFQALEPMLMDMESMANKHYSYINEELSDCHELSQLLTKGLENGDLVIDYLKVGNYSLVTDIITYQTTFYPKTIPIKTMRQNNKIFYYDSWLEAIKHFIIACCALALIAIFIHYKITKNVEFSAIESNPSSIDNRETSLSASTNSPVMDGTMNPSGTQVTRRSTTSQTLTSSNRNISNSTTSATSNINNTDTVKTPTDSNATNIICGLFILSVIFAAITFLSKPVHINWHPDATLTLEVIETDNTNITDNLGQLIHSIEEIQKHASMYHDKAVQALADDLVHHLVRGLGQASVEIANAYTTGVTVLSTFRRTYERIEEKAKKAGKLKDTNTRDLLLELNKTADSYETLQRHLEVEMVRQQNTIPILKDQVKSMRAFMQEDRMAELKTITSHQEKALDNISTGINGAKVRLEQVLFTVDNEHGYGLKHTIKSLIGECSDHKWTAALEIAGGGGAMALGGGGSVGTYFGLVALKAGGYALASFSAPVIAAPLVAAVGVGTGVYFMIDGFKNFRAASNYQKELEILEIDRANMKIVLEQLQEAIANQTKSVDSSLKSMNKLAEHSSRFSSISGFQLNQKQRDAINDELLNLMKQYDTIMAINALFIKNVPKHDRSLPPT